MIRLLIAAVLLISASAGAPVEVEGLLFTGPLVGELSAVGPRPLPLLEGPVDEFLAAAGADVPIEAVVPVRAPGVEITCAPGPTVLNGNLPSKVIRWTCGINNRSAEARDISEAMMVTAMLSAGVSAIDSASMAMYHEHEAKMGFWARAGIYTARAPRPLITAIALGLLKVRTDEAVIVGALDMLLPFMSERFLERAEILPVPIWTETVSLPPGAFILRQGYSAEWSGPVPVRVVIP